MFQLLNYSYLSSKYHSTLIKYLKKYICPLEIAWVHIVFICVIKKFLLLEEFRVVSLIGDEIDIVVDVFDDSTRETSSEESIVDVTVGEEFTE